MAGAPAEDRAVEQRVAHHAVAPVHAARDLAGGVEARRRSSRRARRSRGRRSGSAARGRCGSARRAGRCPPRGSAAACTAARSRRRRRAIGRQSSSTDGPPSGVVRPRPSSHSRTIAAATTSRPPSSSTKRSPCGVEQHGAVRARRLGDRVALHRVGQSPPFGWYCSASRSRASQPAASAISVTSPVAPAAFVENVPRRLASAKQRPPAASTMAPAATGRLPPLALPERRAPPRRASRSSAASGAWSSVSMRASAADGLAQRRRDRVPGAVADLQQPLARRAAAAREPVARRRRRA